MADSTLNSPAENTRTPAENTGTPANTHVVLTADNPKGYPPFDICLVLVYTNNQLHYYHTSGALLDVDKAKFRIQMKKCKNTLKLIN